MYGELGNDYFDTRNGRWNFVDGGEGANVHKRDSFDVGTAISYTNPFEESDTNKPIVVKVMVMAFDPVVESEGGKRLHEVFQWRNPVYNVMAYKEAMERVSGGFVTFEITHWTDFNEFPYFLDGYQYTPEEYVANRRSGSGWHEGAGDVCRAMTDAGVPALVDAGEVDEVWWVGEHYVPGGGEAFMVGPGAFFINGATFPDLDVDRPIAVGRTARKIILDARIIIAGTSRILRRPGIISALISRSRQRLPALAVATTPLIAKGTTTGITRRTSKRPQTTGSIIRI